MSQKILDLSLSDLGSTQPERVGGAVLARIIRAIVARIQPDPKGDPSLREIVSQAARLGHQDALAVCLGDRVGEAPAKERQRRSR